MRRKRPFSRRIEEALALERPANGFETRLQIPFAMRERDPGDHLKLTARLVEGTGSAKTNALAVDHPRLGALRVGAEEHAAELSAFELVVEREIKGLLT